MPRTPGSPSIKTPTRGYALAFSFTFPSLPIWYYVCSSSYNSIIGAY
nr:MAG TPA: hypothetical protein [Caudoviricetes sp.]